MDLNDLPDLPDDLPEEMRAKLAALLDIGDHLHSVALTTNELALIGFALDLLGERMPAQMRQAPAEIIPMLSQMSGDAALLRQRLGAVVRSDVSTVLGGD